MISELERLYRQQTFMLELSLEVEEPEPEPYAWLPREFWPRKETPAETVEERRASLLRLHPEDVVTSSDENEELQIVELRELARSVNGAQPLDFQICFGGVDYSAAEDLSDQAWSRIDPNDADSLCAQAFGCGAFTSEDAALLKERVLAEVGGYDGDPTLLGEIEYLSAAGQLACLAQDRLSQADEDQAQVLSELAAGCQEYIGYRTEYLTELGLL